ncbi:UNVERIFIED_CONTAM: hypothetical protein HDU68_005913 [Siphonaria sp. JEL0065]|nr:hypothetical protein HDU68_005913 [Siphonaria sp. JEL0065]
MPLSNDYLQIARRARALLLSYLILQNQSELEHDTTLELKHLMFKLSKDLFPWINDPIYKLHQRFLNSTEGGIVLTTGHQHFNHALLGIKSLRKILKCTLPIEVHYAGPNDLDDTMVQKLSKLQGVTTVNLLDHFPQEAVYLKGWSIKPFSILASRFRRVIFMDADVLFFQDPARVLLLDSEIFREYGQLFYHDRSLNRGDGEFSTWFQSINPHISKYAKDLRWANRLSWHEQEAGLVVMDKGWIGVLFSLLLACKLNSHEMWAETYSHMWGDKETFWLSMELLRVPFKFSPGYSGAVGYKVDEVVCGSNFHTDEKLKPFWWNGGVLQNRRKNGEVFMKFEYAAFDSERDTLKWKEETAESPFCLQPMFPEVEVRKLSESEKGIGLAYIQMYKEIARRG